MTKMYFCIAGQTFFLTSLILAIGNVRQGIFYVRGRALRRTEEPWFFTVFAGYVIFGAICGFLVLTATVYEIYSGTTIINLHAWEYGVKAFFAATAGSLVHLIYYFVLELPGRIFRWLGSVIAASFGGSPAKDKEKE